MINDNCVIHESVQIIEPVNLYGCDLKENVFVGPFVEIQTNVTIGKNSRIQSHSFICSAVVIGEDCFIGHGTVFVNDKFSNNKVNYERDFEETIINDNVIIGSNATILPVEICSGAIIGAGSVVTKNIDQPGKYAGNPAKLIN
tara:strand:- start:23 stop:451 length:429 start_codon:yes stop_codon:yes gene_type:complete